MVAGGETADCRGGASPRRVGSRDCPSARDEYESGLYLAASRARITGYVARSRVVGFGYAACDGSTRVRSGRFRHHDTRLAHQRAKLHGVDPQCYLADVLDPIVSERTKANALRELLPWNWMAAVAAAI